MLSKLDAAECVLTALGIFQFHFVTSDPNPVEPAKLEANSKPTGYRFLGVKESNVFGTSLHFFVNLRWVFFIPSILDIYFTLQDYQNGTSPFPSPSDKDLKNRYFNIRAFATFFLFVGAQLRAFAYMTLGRSFTFYLSIREDQKLVKTGIYSIVRHPSYLGAELMALGASFYPLTGRFGVYVLGTPLWTPTQFYAFPALVVLMVVFGIPSRVRKEEKMLFDGFGKEWVDYTKAVPWRVLPFVY